MYPQTRGMWSKWWLVQVSKEKNKGAKYRMRSELSALRKEVRICFSLIGLTDLVTSLLAPRNV